MSAVTVTPDETLELRLKAMRLSCLLAHYIQVAEQAAHEGWTHVRYLSELVVLKAAERSDRRIARLLHDAKLPRDKTLVTLDLNRYAAPLRTQIRQLLRCELVAGATNVCLIGRPGTGKSHLLAALGLALVDDGHSVLFIPVATIVERLLEAKAQPAARS